MIPILHVANLTKTFDRLIAVNDVSFDLEPNTVTALIGPNGAGKSTCFNLLGGSIAPNTGHVVFDNIDLTRMPQHKRIRKGIGRTFQIAATFSSMTVAENIRTALQACNRSIDEIDQLLSMVGASDMAHRRITELSYGDVKCVELAMALVGRPRFLLLDEPTAGMSSSARTEIIELVVRIAEERKMTVLFTEHDMEAVFGFASRILVMDQGRLIADGAPDEIRKNALVQSVYLDDEDQPHA
jgi:branched-chain amino acid transport system ATP-binding protein